MLPTLPLPAIRCRLRLIKGISLLEVLIALLILGLGVLGFMALQLKAMNSTLNAHLISQGMSIATDLAERIRLNPSQIGTYINGKCVGDSLSALGTTTCFGDAANCTSADLATWDPQDLCPQVSSLLPDGIFNIDSSGLGVNIYVGWNVGSTASGFDADSWTCTGGATNCITLEVVP